MIAFGYKWCKVVAMKAVTLRFDSEEFQKLKDIKAQGFGSINEVIKCAVLSFASAAPEDTQPPATDGGNERSAA